MLEKLRPVLDYLDRHRDLVADEYSGYRLEKITGGRNNLIWRCTGEGDDLCVKFTVPGPRDRAGREFHALQLLERARVVAPRALGLDRDTYSTPLVVQSWVEGAVLNRVPTDDGEWAQLLDHIGRVHDIGPDPSSSAIRPALLDACTQAAGLQLLDREIASVPAASQPADLGRLRQRLERVTPPEWDPAAPRLARMDYKPDNFIRLSQGWISVDWENSGWTDPAFDLAQLMAHPEYLAVSQSRWDWLVAHYPGADKRFALRVRTYHRILLVFWVARLSRSLYEIPRGGDQRLVEPRPGWQAEAEEKRRVYIELAEDRL